MSVASGFADELVVVLTVARIVRARSPCGSPTASSRVAGNAKGRAVTPVSTRAAALILVGADERVTPDLAAEIRQVVVTSTASWHLIPVDNYIGDRLVRWGWGASFGRSAYAGLFRKGAKLWGDQRIHPAVTLSGAAGARLEARLVHYVDRNISDMLRRLDHYTTARALDLRDGGDIGSYARNLRRIPTRFWKCVSVAAAIAKGRRVS